MDTEGTKEQADTDWLADLTNEPSEADTEGDTPEVEADAGTEDEDKAEGDKSEDAGEDAGDEDKPEDKAKSDEDEDDEKPKRRLSGSERLKRRLAAAEAELAEIRRGARSGDITLADIEREIGAKPKEEDYKGDFLAYERALTAYELDARQAARELRKATERAQTAQAAAMREAVEEHNERIEEFRAKVPDFDKTLQAASHLKASPIVEALVIESDNSAHLVYHLAKNPERLDRLNRMSEREAAREIGRIEARLSLPKPKTETKAPPPVTSPKGGSKPRSADDDLNAWLGKVYGT